MGNSISSPDSYPTILKSFALVEADVRQELEKQVEQIEKAIFRLGWLIPFAVALAGLLVAFLVFAATIPSSEVTVWIAQRMRDPRMSVVIVAGFVVLLFFLVQIQVSLWWHRLAGKVTRNPIRQRMPAWAWIVVFLVFEPLLLTLTLGLLNFSTFISTFDWIEVLGFVILVEMLIVAFAIGFIGLSFLLRPVVPRWVLLIPVTFTTKRTDERSPFPGYPELTSAIVHAVLKKHEHLTQSEWRQIRRIAQYRYQGIEARGQAVALALGTFGLIGLLLEVLGNEVVTRFLGTYGERVGWGMLLVIFMLGSIWYFSRIYYWMYVKELVSLLEEFVEQPKNRHNLNEPRCCLLSWLERLWKKG